MPPEDVKRKPVYIIRPFLTMFVAVCSVEVFGMVWFVFAPAPVSQTTSASVVGFHLSTSSSKQILLSSIVIELVRDFICDDASDSRKVMYLYVRIDI